MSRSILMRGILWTAALLSVSWGVSRPVVGEDPPGGATRPEVSAAIAVLSSPAPREEKVNACRRLAALGGPEAIGPLAALLSDKDMSHPARLALEVIPDPAAGNALRAALSSVSGGPLVGVINSLAARRETEAVADLARLVGASDPQVAAAACTALGTIATPDALTLLEHAQTQVPEAARREWGLACLRGVCALHEKGQHDEAVRLCDVLLQAPLPAYLHHAVMRQRLLARPEDVGPRLQELLTSPDDAAFGMALTVSRELSAPQVIPLLVASLPNLPTARRVLAIQLLGDRGDPTAQDALRQFASGGEVTERGAALRALGSTGDASTLPLLLAATHDPTEEIVAAAQDALMALRGEEVDRAVMEALAKSDGAQRRFLIDVVGQRQIASATPLLISLADDPDASTRMAAVRALGYVVTPAQLPTLTGRLASTTNAEERTAVLLALRAACRRSADPDACARQLQNILPQADRDTKLFAIELLGALGGRVALESISVLAKENDESIQDAATSVLGRWRTPDVAPVLLDLAHAAPQEKYRIRALRGYLRVIRQMDLPNADRLTMYRQALEAATRNEERLLAVETLGRIPMAEALAEAVKQLENEPLRAAACLAAVTIAEATVRVQPSAVAEPMRRVLAVTQDAEITRRAQAVLAASSQ